MTLEITKEIIEKEYNVNKLSIRDIAKKYGGTKGQVEYLMDLYGIARRSYTEAKKVRENREMDEKQIEAIESLEFKVGNFEMRKDFPPVIRKNMLIPIPVDGKSRDAVVTLVISDMHIGDGDFLPESYWSAISNAMEVMRNINGLYKVKQFNLVLNGDITNGVDVYNRQELRNIIQRGHWQVFATEMIIKDTLDKLNELFTTEEICLIRGTHDTLSSNLVLYLKRVLPNKTKYLSHGGLYNIAGKLGEYNVLFMHGTGTSYSCPVTYKSFSDVFANVDMYRNQRINVDRVCTAHTHWLSTGFIVNNMYWDTTGGFQKWEYTINQRPCGLIVYLYSAGEVVAIPVRPDPMVEMKEKCNPRLEYNNFIYYGSMLLKHVKEIEGIE